ncbi:hypothetical protein F4821DRAFT_234101 [Hypoxylon rubiginosum]|uniref:Uncharacterized protein n=1 Tax=Hypoxylon rubiginosum TaxID=110542 RepID=A0ACC0D6N8_9PEZI|nr:hypothetical protein F4821DRAFT_234101 [Hypoxylon rubiginosum]
MSVGRYLTNAINSNKADLRILRSIHKQLGIKSPDALLSSRKREQAAKKSGLLSSSSSKTPNKLRVFANVLRAVARMRISAREWGEHERTRKRLVDALEENKRREVAELN